MRKVIWYLVIVAIVCAIIGGITGVHFFTGIGTFSVCSAGVLFLIKLFDKFFIKK